MSLSEVFPTFLFISPFSAYFKHHPNCVQIWALLTQAPKITLSSVWLSGRGWDKAIVPLLVQKWALTVHHVYYHCLLPNSVLFVILSLLFYSLRNAYEITWGYKTVPQSSVSFEHNILIFDQFLQTKGLSVSVSELCWSCYSFHLFLPLQMSWFLKDKVCLCFLHSVLLRSSY